MLFIPFLPCRQGSGFISETIVSPLNCETKTNFWSNQQKHFLHGRRVFIHLSKLHGRSYVSGLMEEESTKNFSASCFYPNPPAQRSPTEWVKKITSLQHALSKLHGRAMSQASWKRKARKIFQHPASIQIPQRSVHPRSGSRK